MLVVFQNLVSENKPAPLPSSIEFTSLLQISRLDYVLLHVLSGTQQRANPLALQGFCFSIKNVVSALDADDETVGVLQITGGLSRVNLHLDHFVNGDRT